jgi:hypothetical protein
LPENESDLQDDGELVHKRQYFYNLLLDGIKHRVVLELSLYDHRGTESEFTVL